MEMDDVDHLQQDIQQALKRARNLLTAAQNTKHAKARHLALVVTKLEEAEMWFERDTQ